MDIVESIWVALLSDYCGNRSSSLNYSLKSLKILRREEHENSKSAIMIKIIFMRAQGCMRRICITTSIQN